MQALMTIESRSLRDATERVAQSLDLGQHWLRQSGGRQSSLTATLKAIDMPTAGSG